jgi:hypothetical protein
LSRPDCQIEASLILLIFFYPFCNLHIFTNTILTKKTLQVNTFASIIEKHMKITEKSFKKSALIAVVHKQFTN